MHKSLLVSGLLLVSLAVKAELSLEAEVNTLWQAKDFTAARALLQVQINKKTKDAKLLALLGQTEAQLNNAERAEELLEKAIKYDASNADYQHWYATVSCNLASNASMFSAMGYAKRCKKAYEAALELAPKNPRSYIALGSFYAQAPGIVGGDVEKASGLAQQLKQIDPLQGALLTLKVSDLKDDAVFSALLAQDELLTQRPETYLLRGVAFSRTDEHAKALALFEQAVTMPAADEDAADAIAQAQYQIGRTAVKGEMEFAKGIAALQQFIAKNGTADNIDWAKLRLGQLYMLQQQPDKAREIFQPLMASTRDKKVKDELAKLL
jgi:tetratricopeptide (TPR) repeat protein